MPAGPSAALSGIQPRKRRKLVRGNAARGKFAALKGLEVRIPASVFNFTEDVLFPAYVVGRDSTHAGCLTVRFKHWKERYFFPLEQIEAWILENSDAGPSRLRDFSSWPPNQGSLNRLVRTVYAHGGEGGAAGSGGGGASAPAFSDDTNGVADTNGRDDTHGRDDVTCDVTGGAEDRDDIASAEGAGRTAARGNDGVQGGGAGSSGGSEYAFARVKKEVEVEKEAAARAHVQTPPPPPARPVPLAAAAAPGGAPRPRRWRVKQEDLACAVPGERAAEWEAHVKLLLEDAERWRRQRRDDASPRFVPLPAGELVGREVLMPLSFVQQQQQQQQQQPDALRGRVLAQHLTQGERLVVVMLYARPDKAYIVDADVAAAALLPAGVPVPPDDLMASEQEQMEEEQLGEERGQGRERGQEEEQHGQPLNQQQEEQGEGMYRIRANGGDGPQGRREALSGSSTDAADASSTLTAHPEPDQDNNHQQQAPGQLPLQQHQQGGGKHHGERAPRPQAGRASGSPSSPPIGAAAQGGGSAAPVDRIAPCAEGWGRRIRRAMA